MPVKERLRRLTNHIPDAGEDPDLAAISLLVGRGDSVVDVGAGDGRFTRFLAERVGSRGRVVSVEPEPPAFAALADEVRRLGLRNVEPLHFAVTAGESSVVVGPAVVECRRLDDLFAAAARPVRFIRSSVAGSELGCLRGALEVIERSRPAWLLSLSSDPDAPLSAAAEVMHRMRQAGYAAFGFDGTRFQPRGPGERREAYFFLTSDHQPTVSRG
jgi:hypothetical protein